MKGSKLALALFLVVVSVASGVAKHKHSTIASPSPRPPPIQNDLGTDQNPIAVKGSLLTNRPTPTEEQARAESVKAADDHYISVATGGLAWLTAALAAIAIVQVWLFVRQLRLSEKAARDAEMAAKAAKASADALPKIERAYVFVEITLRDAQQKLAGPSKVECDVIFTNHGKTPAILKRLRADAYWCDTAPAELIKAPRSDRQMPDGMVIGAGKEFKLRLTRVLDENEKHDLFDVVWSVYFVGLVEYDDIMGVTHRTGFCWRTHTVDQYLETSIAPSPLNYFD